MLPTLGQPPQRFADFAVEAKFDGQRGVAVLDGSVVTLLSRGSAALAERIGAAADGLRMTTDQAVR